MAKLAHKAASVILFCALFLLAGRYVHTYPLPMTPQQQQYLIRISEAFGVADYELFYIGAMIAIDLIVAIAAHRVLTGLWRRYFAAR